MKKQYFEFENTLFSPIKTKEGWTVSSLSGILNLKPYKNRKHLINFLKSCGAKEV
jgi:hypothetical protein